MVGSPLARALSRLHLPISVKSCRSRRYCGLADSPVLLNVDVHGSSQIGGAKPLVICHGLFGCRHNFRSIALALATRLRTRVYCVDMRNHGDSPWSDHMDYASMAADLKLTIEEHIFRRAQIDKINLVGHSMGGRAVMELALHHIEARQFIDKIVIEDVAPRPPPSPTDIPSYISFMLQLERDLWQFDRLSQARAFCDTELKKVVPELAVRQFLLTNLIEEPSGAIAWRVNLRAIESSLDKLLGMDLNPNNLSACLRPTMVVYGAKSDYVTPSDMDQYTHLFPNIQFECIPGAGHWVHADNPNLFLGVLVRFLRASIFDR